MRIIIAGAGISGLTTYLFLQKLLPSILHCEIIIYEKHPPNSSTSSDDPTSFAVVGGALGIGPNGLIALRALSEDLYQEILSLGYACTHFSIQNAKGWNIGSFRATNYDDPPLPTVLISRHKLWECIRRRVPDKAIVHTLITEISITRDAQPLIHHSASSSPEKADLIIGADGVHSIVRKAVAGNGGECNDWAAHYE